MHRIYPTLQLKRQCSISLYLHDDITVPVLSISLFLLNIIALDDPNANIHDLSAHSKYCL